MTKIMVRSHPSPNHGPRRDGASIDMVVIHYTEMPDALSALGRLCDPQSQVSAHYLIDQGGQVHQLVDEDRRAWHAGVSYWQGDRDINSRSIGIELDHPGHAGGNPAFSAALMDSLVDLLGAIRQRHGIKPRHVLGHSDIAIGRKIDPGEMFDWSCLAKAGHTLWPRLSLAIQANHQPCDPARFSDLLDIFGYDASAPLVTEAFQRHFRPGLINNQPDQECLSILAALVDQIV
jgi:N-acetylmuramoyl-L-alanine amidase